MSTPDGNGEVIQASGCHWIIISTTNTNGMVRTFLNVPMGDYVGGEKRSGLNDASIMNVVYIINTEYMYL